MTAHKHAEMIKAKADNMELVVFTRLPEDSWWETGECGFPVDEAIDYFLCMPKHKEACLNWLNGGESHVALDSINWTSLPSYAGAKWRSSNSIWYMSEHGISRVKPAKQKRWVVYNSKGEFCSEHDCKYVPVDETLQIIEIEVEV